MALIALMEGVGILHRSGADAALFIANLGFDPEGWWFRSEVQEARSKFIEKYANFSSNWKMQWEIEFKSAIDQVGSITS
jgi:putative transferase (TIGR04331 family)